LNAKPIIKVKPDGAYKAFTSGEKFPLSTAGLQIDYKNNRLLVAGFNGTEIMDNDPKTKGVSFLRVYDLKTGLLQNEINLSYLAPNASAYFANDIAVDNRGNVYITDWYAQVIYRVALDGKASLFWQNKTGIKSGPNGIDFKDGYLLASILTVDKKGLYSNYGLVKIPVDNPSSAKLVEIDDRQYSGFDGMVIKPNGDVVGVTNNQKTPGGNRLITLRSSDDFKTAKVVNSKDMAPSTTVAVAPDDKNFVINQDFTNNSKKDWDIEEIKF
jgi:sugar lactone lactonase YvrE